MKIQKILSFSSNKDNFFFILLCLYPWFLISGPFLSDLVVIIFTLYFIYQQILDRNFKEFKNFFFIIFILFSIYILLNSILLVGNLVSIKSSLTFFRFGFFALAISFILKKNKSRLKYFFYSIIVSFISLFLDSIFQKIFGFNLLGVEMQHSIRVSSFFGDELILGSFVFKITPIILAFIYYLFKEKSNFYSLVITFLSLIIILLSAEKTALFSMMIFSFLFFIVIEYSFKIKVIIILFFFSLLTSILLLNEPIKNRIYNQLILNSGNGKYIYTKVHDSHFRTAYKMFIDKPIFGHGPKMFRYKCSDKNYKIDQHSCSTHPHNFVLQILSETGLVGFFFYLFLYLVILKNFIINLFLSLSKKKIFMPEYLLYSSLVVIFLPLATSGNIFNNWLSCIHFFNIGILLFFFNEKKDENL